MLSKKFRLRTKDVRFLTNKKNYFSSGFFGFFFVKQYQNLDFNQISCHISIKFSKKSTDRNYIKRIIYEYFFGRGISDLFIGNKHYKIFVILQKNKIEEFKKQIENHGKKDIVQFVYDAIGKSFSDLMLYLGKNNL